MANTHFFILNPHRDDFVWRPLYFKYIKRNPLLKYKYIQELYNKKNTETQYTILVSNKCSGIIPQKWLNILPKGIRKKLINREMDSWRKINNIPKHAKIQFIEEIELQPNTNNIIFAFQYSNTRYAQELKHYLEKFSKTIFHLSHYYINPKNVSNELSSIHNIEFCGDVDVTKSTFFQKYFPWYNKSFYLTPFSIADRFQKKQDISNRSDKVITTGTFHNIELFPESLYLKKDIGVNTFHYNRRGFYENKETMFANSITCYNSPWLDSNKKWYQKIISLTGKGAQKSYFTFDIVEEYNKHKFALIGEEICGFPGIGTFEAMACGCVVLANKNTFEGLHIPDNCYINIENKQLEEAINEAKKYTTNKMEEISENATIFINQHLRSEHCLLRFQKVLGLT